MDDANTTTVFSFSSLWFVVGNSMMLLLLMLEDLVMKMRMSCMDNGGVVEDLEDSAISVSTFRK